VEDETRFRCVFGQKGDSSRKVILTVLAFDVPQDEAKPKAVPRARKR
jgi:hypothetical protein